jgi:uncharacterized repeat protein (TIGR01451 family)
MDCRPIAATPRGDFPAPHIAGRWSRDEYLCNGGDALPPVSVGTDGTLRGLQLEEAVLRFDTIDGRTLVEPSNRVCLYAPRFAAVRKVTGVMQNERHTQLSHIEGESLAQGLGLPQIASTVEQPVDPRREIGTTLAISLEEATRGMPLENVQRLVEDRHAFLPYEDFAMIRYGILDERERTQLAQSTQAAVAWSDTQAIQVIIEGQQAAIEASAQPVHRLNEYTLAGTPRMRLVKVASTHAAQPGEFVDFTIRLDNIGSQTVQNVTIVDNLTTRLELVPNSAQSSLDAAFFTAVNEGESLVLRWEMASPLPPGKGGIIRFRCRVR